ncbi:hypothetical protein V1478_014418 [Vespula squamosa]|uniref:Uncharacterized protein n=1 Tax=Vespula squamosa TaxID=30214 RepID=A0ABD2A876_VESSQ
MFIWCDIFHRSNNSTCLFYSKHDVLKFMKSDDLNSNQYFDYISQTMTDFFFILLQISCFRGKVKNLHLYSTLMCVNVIIQYGQL